MAASQGHLRRSSSPPRRQRACQPCSKAKARCNFPDNDVASGCDRCRRVMISCQPQTTKFIRKPRQLKHDSSRPSSAEPGGPASPTEVYSDQIYSSSEFQGPEEGNNLSSPVLVMMQSNYDTGDQTMLHPYYQNMYPQQVQPYQTTPETTLPGSIYQSNVQSYTNFSVPQYQSMAWTQAGQMVLPVTSAQYGYALPYATTTSPEVLPGRLYKTEDL